MPWASAAEIKLVGCMGSAPRLTTNTDLQVVPPGSMTLKVFPNPGKDVLYVNLTGYEGNTDIQVYDIRGRLVMKRSTNMSKTSLNISALPAGTYMVKVLNNNKEDVVKFIKQ